MRLAQEMAMSSGLFASEVIDCAGRSSQSIVNVGRAFCVTVSIVKLQIVRRQKPKHPNEMQHEYDLLLGCSVYNYALRKQDIPDALNSNLASRKLEIQEVCISVSIRGLPTDK